MREESFRQEDARYNELSRRMNVSPEFLGPGLSFGFEDEILLSVGGVELEPLTQDEIWSLLEGDGAVQGGLMVIKYMRRSSWILSNPAPLARLGIVRVFRHMLKVGTLLPNQSMTYDSVDEDEVRLPLIWIVLLSTIYRVIDGPHSLCDPDFKCFRHLLKLDGCCVNSTNLGSRDREWPIHVCSGSSCVPPAVLSALLERRDLDLNAKDRGGNTAVHYAVGAVPKNERRTMHWRGGNMAKLTLLLQAGADASLQNDRGQRASDFLRLELDRENITGREKRQAIRMLEVLSS